MPGAGPWRVVLLVAGDAFLPIEVDVPGVPGGYTRGVPKFAGARA